MRLTLSEPAIDAELFAEGQSPLTLQIDALRAEAAAEAGKEAAEVAAGFERIAAYLSEIDLTAIWDAATEDERRVLIDELLDGIEIHTDHLEVLVHGRRDSA